MGPGNYLLGIAKCAMETPTLLGGLLALSHSPPAASRKVLLQGQGTPLQAPASLGLPHPKQTVNRTQTTVLQPVPHHLPLNLI